MEASLNGEVTLDDVSDRSDLESCGLNLFIFGYRFIKEEEILKFRFL